MMTTSASIRSEPLTFERSDWIEIPSQTCIVITAKMNVLQIPIEDAYSTVLESRKAGFAQRKGFGFILNALDKEI